MEHFGVRITQKKYSLHPVREEFAPINTKDSLCKFKSLEKKNAYADESGRTYRQEWCEEYRELCLQNYDLNMQYFSGLDRAEFERAVSAFVKHFKMRQVETLWDYDGVPGYYFMILDQYAQAYIGKTEDIKKRIQSHWTIVRPFDRTLFPLYAVKTSNFSIDFFRALDTTRLYALSSPLIEGIEEEMVTHFPGTFLLNRIGGDIESGVDAFLTRNARGL